ncbi:MAG: hypothetical protein G01um101418_305 [Parcubacteria group bacterium Gr01-1014_18]|nr:MAG: hypothetical protein Greene041636_319 [Parcubacteria group bacterium Greene0416_36]TSC81165.1 MAG: hypothetical protein G01um101418_305 [Parcubacteria group bacterium Gr01-1014_18]TSC99162.1 MAG: hypothetical protein Greene101420_307 [Parcubacteria group bacterium Greene1014_20]TSD07480.1 MAG: hypothetical protein Greene07142_179 [Parcubacteria group bacterium Greene0714_2]
MNRIFIFIRTVFSHPFGVAFLVFLLSFAFFWILAPFGSFSDPDSFYHIAITRNLASLGIPDTFPSLLYTHLAGAFTDHHFLYHILLWPFIFLFGDFEGARLSAIFFAALFPAFFYLFLRFFNVRYPLIWTLFLFLMPAFVFRIHLVKAVGLSILFLLIFCYLLIRDKKWALFFLSFLYVWLYGGFLIMPAVWFLYWVSRMIYKIIQEPGSFRERAAHLVSDKKNWMDSSVLGSGILIFLGMSLGLVINPFFPDNLYFYWIQTVEIALFNYSEAIGVGAEWYPYTFSTLFNGNIFYFFLLFVFVPLLAMGIKKMSKESLFFFLVSALFFILTLKSRRYIEYAVPFGVLFGAFVFRDWNFTWNDVRRAINKKIVLYILCFSILWALYQFLFLKDAVGGFRWDRYSHASLWISENIPKGSLVFNSDWDDFPILYYRGKDFYYMTGLDPTFMYRYSSEKYEVWRKISSGEQTSDISRDIVGKLGSHTVFVDRTDQKLLDENLAKDPRAKVGYQDSEASIYILE